jgi:hypothetical protein
LAGAVQSPALQQVPIEMHAPPQRLKFALQVKSQEPFGLQTGLPFAGALQSLALQQLVERMQAVPQAL